jgi:hypothetical protein
MKVYSLFVFVFIFACAVRADYPSLYENSPFGVNSPKIIENKVDGDNEFEFHGICLFDDGYMFSIFNRASNRRCWLKLGEILDGVSIKKYDKKRCAIDVVLPDGSGKNLQLARCAVHPYHVQFVRSENSGTFVPEEARRKFLDIMCEEKK